MVAVVVAVVLALMGLDPCGFVLHEYSVPRAPGDDFAGTCPYHQGHCVEGNTASGALARRAVRLCVCPCVRIPGDDGAAC